MNCATNKSDVDDPLTYFIKRRKGHNTAAYADNCFLPFALLAARTFLPPFVLILDLNP